MVPIKDLWTADQISNQLRTDNVHVDHKRIRGAIGGLVERGLVKEKGKYFQRETVRMQIKQDDTGSPAVPKLGDFMNIEKFVAVAQEPTQEIKAEPIPMKKDLPVAGTPAPKPVQPLDVLSTIATEMVEFSKMVNSTMAKFATRIEEAALLVEAQRETDKEQLAKMEQMQNMLRSFVQ